MSSPLKETARRFVEIAVQHKTASKICPAFIDLQIISCGGSDVYRTSTVLDALAFPFLRSLKGWRRHNNRFKITQNGSRRVAKIVGR